MYIVYPACFLKKSNGKYDVMFPDLPLAITSGDDFSDATRKAFECLSLYYFENAELGIETKDPTDIKSVDVLGAANMWDCDPKDIEVYPVGADVTAIAKNVFKKQIHKNVTIESWVDTKAQSLGISFSKTLQEALIEKIKEQKLETLRTSIADKG